MIGRTLLSFFGDERAATAVEYGLVAAMVGIGIAGALISFRSALTGVFGAVAGAVSAAIS